MIGRQKFQSPAQGARLRERRRLGSWQRHCQSEPAPPLRDCGAIGVRCCAGAGVVLSGDASSLGDSAMIKHLQLRLPLALLNMLRKAARENLRSINSEIIYRLAMSFNGSRQ